MAQINGPLFAPPVTRAVLRPYQAVAIETLRSHRGAGRKRLLLTLPTGAGKTLTASELIRSALEMGRRVLFVVHLRELVEQTVRAFARLGIDHVGVMRGDAGRVDVSAPVQIASIQTLARRARPAADVIILDEAHRSLSDSYVKHVWEAYPEAIVIGLTATPCRGDGRPLGERYDALVVGATYSELIASGHVADPIVYAPRVDVDLSGIRRIGGDWADDEVEKAMTAIVGDIVPTWKERAEGRTTICFASGIAHSKDIVRRFLEAGVAAEHLDGTTPGDERDAILERLASGTTTLVSNCAVLTEGFDAPAVRCVISARPTLSLVLHMQTAGRGLRPGALRPIILDHAGNVGRHGMPHEDRVWSLTGPAKRPSVKNPFRTCKKCFAYVLARVPLCPHCGFEQHPAERELPREETATKIERVNVADVERDFYVSAVNLARARGFKPGMASFKFKEKYGRWPPWAWSSETKERFALDEDWQARLEHRTREREFWKEADEKAATTAPVSAADRMRAAAARAPVERDEAPVDDGYYDDIPF